VGGEEEGHARACAVWGVVCAGGGGGGGVCGVCVCACACARVCGKRWGEGSDLGYKSKSLVERLR
jgi:hypothetical protein